ncbi:MAG: hypothetical protein WB507_05110 [Solirubrobacterales bacterium]
MSRIPIALGVTLLLGFLFGADYAQAAPVTLDFESGVGLNEAVTSQYGPPGTPAGPTFMAGTEAGLKGLECPAPHLVNTYGAHSGTHELKLDGCESGEFWPSEGFFSLGYSTEKVEFWVASDTPLGSSTVTSTAFNSKGEFLLQDETELPSNSEPLYEPVTLESPGGEIASVAIQLGKNFGSNPNSSTGVTEGAGNTDLLVDDLTYYPPASPPESSFRLGANPPAVATTAGNEVAVKIPVTWTNNPEPSKSPVQFEVSAPPGVEGSFSENPSSSGHSVLNLKIAKNATPGQTEVTVTGYVEKGKAGEKTASIEIPLGISSALEVSGVQTVTVAPCTPRQVELRLATPSYVTEPVTLEVTTVNQPGVTISSITGGEVISPGHARTTVTPTPTTSGGREAKATVTLSVAGGTEPAAARPWGVRASSAEYGEDFVTGNLAISTGVVNEAVSTGTSYTPQTVSTPALHHPGSQLTLRGAGFCAGSTVSIGDFSSEGEETENQATPESIAPDGTSLTFRVPRGAISGPIVVLPPTGKRIEGPSLNVRTFRNTYGFSWVNGDYGLRFDDEIGDELFGKAETNVEPLPGWLVRKPEAVLFEEMTNKHIPGGICFGMAYTSLELHEFPGETSRFPQTGGDDPWHLDSPTAPSEALLRLVTENFSLQFTDQLIPAEVNAVIGIHGTNDDINAIEEELAAGHPVMIGLIHFGNLLEGGSLVEGHTVLAYDSRPLPGGGTAIYVANSNVPYSTNEESNSEEHNHNQFKRSEIILKEGNWEFPEGAEFEHSGGKPWTGSEAGLVVYRYRELPILNGERPHLPNLLTAALMSFGSSADKVTQLSEGHSSLVSGSQLAPQASWPKGVAPLPDFNSKPSPLQLVSFNRNVAGPLTATVARSPGGGAMNLNLPGLQASLQAGAHSGQIDQVTVDPRTDAIGYKTSASHAPFGGTLLSTPGASGGGGGASAVQASGGAKSSLSDRLVEFHTTGGGGGGEAVSFLGGHVFQLKDAGAPTDVSLALSAFASNGQPIEVQLPAVRLAAGETLHVAPTNWRKLGSAPVRISATVRGRTSARLLRGSAVGKVFARVRSAALTAIGAHHYRLDVGLRVRHAPKQAGLSVAASVLLHGHLVERASPNQLNGSLVHVGSVHLTLPTALAPGHYKLELHLLEITAKGAVQGSVAVTKTVAIRAR